MPICRPSFEIETHEYKTGVQTTRPPCSLTYCNIICHFLTYFLSELFSRGFPTQILIVLCFSTCATGRLSKLTCCLMGVIKRGEYNYEFSPYVNLVGYFEWYLTNLYQLNTLSSIERDDRMALGNFNYFLFLKSWGKFHWSFLPKLFSHKFIHNQI